MRQLERVKCKLRARERITSIGLLEAEQMAPKVCNFVCFCRTLLRVAPPWESCIAKLQGFERMLSAGWLINVQ